MKTFAPLRQNEWEQIQRKATEKFRGDKPTKDSVRETVTNEHKMSWIIWAAILTLVPLFIFTTIKVSAVAVPFATNLIEELSQQTEIAAGIQDAFIIVTAVLFTMLATPALIYFKLLDEDEEIVAQKKKSAKDYKGWKRFTNLAWITPRLPMVIVYISVAWLFIISMAGFREDPTFWWIERLLPVIVEVGLATTIGRILTDNTEYEKLVTKVYETEMKAYKARLKDKEDDKEYLAILSKYMHSGLFQLRRGKTRTQVNEWIEKLDHTALQPILLQEYKRLTDGASFAKAVLSGSEAPIVPIITGRTPEKGLEWTPRSLRQDFQKRGLDMDMKYTQKNLDEDYKGSKGFRNAFRGGGNAFFTMHRKD